MYDSPMRVASAYCRFVYARFRRHPRRFPIRTHSRAASKPQIRACSRVGERQNENAILNVVKRHPVVLDVAIAKPDKVSAQRVVAILGRKGLAHRQHAQKVNGVCDNIHRRAA